MLDNKLICDKMESDERRNKMKTFFEEYGLSVILGCVICLVVVMCSPVGTVIKGGLTDSTEGVKSTGTEVQAKAGKSIKALAGEEEEVPDTIFVGYNSQNSCLVLSHSEDSNGYQGCDTKLGDASELNNPRNKWTEYVGDIERITIENEIKPKNMSHWFAYLSDIHPINGIENINTSNVTDMSYLFYHAGGQDGWWWSQDLSTWDTSKVTNMSHMFEGCTIYELNLSGWDTSNVVNADYFMRNSTVSSVILGGNKPYDSYLSLPYGQNMWDNSNWDPDC